MFEKLDVTVDFGFELGFDETARKLCAVLTKVTRIQCDFAVFTDIDFITDCRDQSCVVGNKHLFGKEKVCS